MKDYQWPSKEGQIIELCVPGAMAMRRLLQQQYAEVARLQAEAPPGQKWPHSSNRLRLISERILDTHAQLHEMLTDTERVFMPELVLSPEEATQRLNKMIVDQRGLIGIEMRNSTVNIAKFNRESVVKSWHYDPLYLPEHMQDPNYSFRPDSEQVKESRAVPEVPARLAKKIAGGKARLGELALAETILAHEEDGAVRLEKIRLLNNRIEGTMNAMIDALKNDGGVALDDRQARAVVEALREEAVAYAKPFIKMKPEIARLVAGNGKIPAAWSLNETLNQRRAS